MTRNQTAAIDLIAQAAPLWESPTFWAAGAVGATLGVGAVAAWATLRAARPKRQLAYWHDTLPLIQQPTLGTLVQRRIAGSGLEVRLHGQALENPRLVTIHLRNTGRSDITSAQFDGGAPIRLLLDLPILELIAVDSVPEEATPPALSFADPPLELRIGPGRIGAGCSVTYTVLVDGHTDVRLRHGLADVKVRRRA
ncbi:hypothetical protein ACGFSI_41740 [Streptomyces virginiae]|uniref:hypothetical protein n=1 Tax=Streptomyces virginiae TaxID=1961 RepID=UPI00371C7AF6